MPGDHCTGVFDAFSVNHAVGPCPVRAVTGLAGREGVDADTPQPGHYGQQPQVYRRQLTGVEVVPVTDRSRGAEQGDRRVSVPRVEPRLPRRQGGQRSPARAGRLSTTRWEARPAMTPPLVRRGSVVSLPRACGDRHGRACRKAGIRLDLSIARRTAGASSRRWHPRKTLSCCDRLTGTGCPDGAEPGPRSSLTAAACCRGCSASPRLEDALHLSPGHRAAGCCGDPRTPRGRRRPPA